MSGFQAINLGGFEVRLVKKAFAISSEATRDGLTSLEAEDATASYIPKFKVQLIFGISGVQHSIASESSSFENPGEIEHGHGMDTKRYLRIP